MSRYNGQAPHGYNEGHNNYNPAANGWTHTGSNDNSRVDFYEKGNTRMDYYPTTVRGFIKHRLCLLLSMSPQLKKKRCLQGTVKTSMNHPAQGPTQMFRRGLDADSFGNVCNEPRYHTGASYQVCSCSNMVVKQLLIHVWSHKLQQVGIQYHRRPL